MEGILFAVFIHSHHQIPVLGLSGIGDNPQALGFTPAYCLHLHHVMEFELRLRYCRHRRPPMGAQVGHVVEIPWFSFCLCWLLLVLARNSLPVREVYLHHGFCHGCCHANRVSVRSDHLGQPNPMLRRCKVNGGVSQLLKESFIPLST